jgi:hypothetical protein
MKLSDMARALGRRGGRARARRLAAPDRQRIASLGGQARARSFQAARRVRDNFRYLEAVDDLRPRAVVRRSSAFAGPLPGIYPGES